MRYFLHFLFALTLALGWLPAGAADAAAPGILPEGLQPSPPNPGLLEQIEQQGGRLPDFSAAAGRGVDGGSPMASPPTGNFNLLVVMVDFSDNVGSLQGPPAIDTLVFGATNSVKHYYSQISYSTLTFVTLDMPSATGWQRATRPYNGPVGYVNANGVLDPPGNLIDDYGFGTFPQNLQGIVADVVPLLDALQTLNLTDYDNDGDGFVDGILFVYSGPGAEITGNPSHIWSSAWNMTDGAGPGPLYTNDGVYVDRFAFDAEYMASFNPNDQTIGIFCHEIGHLLFGLPDLYDYDYSSAGLGAWSLMAAGNWNGPGGSWDGSSPAWPDAWSRTVMGFETPTTLYGNVSNSPGYPFQPVENLSVPGTGQVLRLESPNLGPDEYFLVEYRDNTTASYDSALPGSGLLIYHVDEEKWNAWEGNDFECGSVPCCGCPAYHPLVALEQADGLRDLEFFNNYGDATDPFNLLPSTSPAFAFGTNPESGSYLTCGDSCIAVYGLVVQPWLIMAGINVLCASASPYLSMDISEPIGWALAGQEATYEVTVRNHSALDWVTLTSVGGNWPVSFFDLNTGLPIAYPPSSNMFPGGAWRLGMRVSVPAGTPRGMGDAINLQANSAYGAAAAAVALTQVPECILLVDDDRGLPNETPYMNALQANKLYYDYWNVVTQGPPDPAALAAHEMVIWFTGTGPSPFATLTPRDEAALAGYLDGSGNLLFSSQDYLYDVGPTYFGTVYLHIKDYTDDIATTTNIQGVTGNPVGDGIPSLPLVPPTPFTDQIIPLQPAIPAFESLPGPLTSGITYDSGTSKVLFLAWPFENLPPHGAEMIMLAAADWMGVPPIPLAGFTVSPAQACSASPLTFTNTSTHATDFLWDFGDGITSTLTNPTHTYTVAQPITYTAMLRGTNCCGGPSVFHQSIPVIPWPVAGFDASHAAALVGQTLAFTDTSTYADTYLWDFGDGVTSTLAAPTHAYTAPGTYTVTLTATNACQASVFTQGVTVYGQAVAGFDASLSQVGVGQLVYFTNQSLYAEDYAWNFGDGVGTSTLTSPSYAYATPGTYTVTLSASNLLSTDEAWAVILVTEDGPVLQKMYIPTLNRGAVGGLKVMNKP